MSKTYIFGDLHLRKEQPFLGAAMNTLGLIRQEVKEGDRVVFLGDFFHTARPYPEELRIARNFFEDCKGTVYILAGNHEYLQTRDSYVEDIFKGSDIRFLDEPEELKIGSDSFLALPFMPYYRYSQKGFSSLKEYYEDWLLNKWTPSDDDDPLYVIYHFEDETVFMGPDELGVDLTVIQSRVPNRQVVRIGGHVHIPSHTYLGTPYATRKDESGKISCYWIKDSSEGRFEPVELEEQIRYITTEYDNLSSLELKGAQYYILSVNEIPSVDALYAWKSKYPNVFIDDYSLKFGEDRALVEDDGNKERSISELLKLFIKQNKVDPDTANYLLSVF